jgi:S-(hydroxymethyl)glutathione dehydrogenase/alcohol dehydrogenase
MAIDARSHSCLTLCLHSGTAFGGWKTRDAVPELVRKNMAGELDIDHFITHKFKGVGGTTEAIHALHSGDCLRAVVTY